MSSHDLELARCQSVEFCAGRRSLRLPPEKLSRSFEGARNSREKRFVVNRLCKKVDRTRLHRLRAHRYVSMTCDKDDLFIAVCKQLLKFETIKARKADIEHKARRQVGGTRSRYSRAEANVSAGRRTERKVARSSCGWPHHRPRRTQAHLSADLPVMNAKLSGAQ